MKRQGGFTLIELVVVIVILGILAVTAAPKFMNLQNDARKASLEGLKGSIQGAAGIVYGKAAIEGKEAQDGSSANVTVGDSNIPVSFGYPKATSAALGLAVNGLDSDWLCKNSEVSGNKAPSVKCTFKGKDSYLTDTDKCYVQYTQATSPSSAATTIVVAEGNSCS
ncbi:type II secretion system protein [Photobacterium damselae subsp. damselae]|uniref:type II secretion system protein n=1 Tax=Photobacterium damselae TaxID=38293 RepID=UPI001594168B|nr:type II secretion system protein [Photobacterium damselae]EHA1081653.1 type II secretion system protein [Photobacterium damselae]MBA5683583.1 type II secretion system protein [Photobacterium damselae subsp. damselae]NVH51714.1 type II secretion system protein [Photobacterium damselae subsp. damselae]NVO80517.1 type II secretion system protein [Photobacterium damselae subsp. damselae]